MVGMFTAAALSDDREKENSGINYEGVSLQFS